MPPCDEEKTGSKPSIGKLEEKKKNISVFTTRHEK
jgi:hypothetical protein